MIQTREEFFNKIKDKKICFLGVGITNYPNIYMFNEMGLNIGVCDRKTKDEIEDYNLLKDLGVKFHLGENYLDYLEEYDIIFRAPGFYYNHKKLVELREKGKIITSDIEVFLRLCPCKIIGITGSDGKTTTTSIIYKMLKQSGKVVHLGGNIGKNMLSSIFSITSTDYVVLELSSFQLISMRQSPDIAVITNITPNHLDVHKDMDEYVSAKENIFKHQTSFEKVILNLDDGITSGYKNKTINETLTFSKKHVPDHGAFLDDDGFLCFNNFSKIEKLFHKSKISIPGEHNTENYLAAISAIYGIVDKNDMQYVAENFKGVEHRIEFVNTINGAKYYNDSIATSPGRTKAGLNAFFGKIILLAGGADKKLPYGPMGPDIVSHVKTLILMGDTARKIEKAVLETSSYKVGYPRIVHVENLEQAVLKAKEIAIENDVVLFSPASTSFDAYNNFEERGKHFKSLVNNNKN